MGHENLIQQSIFRDMSEGILVVGMSGIIQFVNPAAARILDRDGSDLQGLPFVQCFFDYPENDAFNQAILDAIYEANTAQQNIVPYFTGTATRQLHVTTSYLREEGEPIGVIAVLNDISELAELRDAVKAMHRIQELNRQLELRNKLLGETFGRFLSDEIVRQLLDTPDGLALGGKKRVLTILMSDLRGFTALSEQMKAQDLIALLNHYLGEMTEVIQGQNGTIIEFIGDGILAIFGAPLSSDRHAAEAVTAAVEMQARMPAVNQWNRERGYPALQMGIGINTGEVIVGNIGSEKRTKYGVVGSHVNLCGRIESYTVGGQILISPETRQCISDPLTVAGTQEVFPKGVTAPLLLSHITGIGEHTCGSEAQPPVPLARPCPVPFFVIREKHSDLTPTPGQITALSATDAVFETEASLALFDNLLLDIGGRLYGKVIARSGSGWHLRFTAFPPGFDDWYSRTTQPLKPEASVHG